MTRLDGSARSFGVVAPPGRPPQWSGALRELERWEWRPEDGGNPRELLAAFLDEHGLGGESAAQTGSTGVAVLLGALGCAAVAGLAPGRTSPVPAVPEIVAVAVRPGGDQVRAGDAAVGDWERSWTEQAHRDAVEQVRAAIARGDVYQANVVGHASAPVTGDPRRLAQVVAALPGAQYAGALSGDGWAVGCASPEQLVRVEGDRVTTVPVKGTSYDRDALRASLKDRAEHVMIVDLERNDLARIARTGSVEVEELYALSGWSGLWHAGSTVAARLADGVSLTDVLVALVPGGSVTGAPKRAACALLAGLEPVGRGPAMGAFGLVRPGGADLGLTIRTAAVADGRVHLWAGGGITWDSDPAAVGRAAAAKAGPVRAALAQVRPSSS
jgi:para-aminobenzoate synthetase component 1